MNVREEDIERAERFLHQLGAEPGSADPCAVQGYALTFGSVAHGAKGPTRFSRLAFGSAPITVPLLFNHDPARPLGRATLVPDDIGLRVRGRITPTAQGADVLALLRDGGVNGLSIGFTVATSKREADARVVTAANLDELSVVVFPADRSARVELVGGDRVPQFHAADPSEREANVMTVADTMADVREAERQLRALRGEPEPVALRVDIFGRTVTPAMEEAQQRSRALLDAYEANGMSPWLRALRSSRPL